MFRREDVIYAAGLFEGEGWVGRTFPDIIKPNGQIYKRHSGRLALEFSMTDREPLEKFQKAFGLGRVTGPHPTPKGRKDHYWYRCTKIEEVQAITAAMYQWLSPRRQEQIRLALLQPS